MSSGATAATLNTSSMVSFTPGNATCCLVLSLAHLQVQDSLPTLSLTKKALNQLISSVGDEMLLKSPNSYSCYEVGQSSRIEYFPLLSS
jgi:hypothetical protein